MIADFRVRHGCRKVDKRRGFWRIASCHALIFRAFRLGIAFAFALSSPLSALQPTMTIAEKPAFLCLPANAAAELIRNEPTATVFDVRDMASYQKAHVEGAAHLSEDRLLAWMRRLPKEAPVVIYCYHGNASKTFAQMFIDFRYSRVFSVDGGYEPLAVALAGSAAA
jgi:thiosulfate sulfurtransferase